MPQIVYRISDKQFFVEWQELALSALICLICVICVKKNTIFETFSLRLCAFAPLRLCVGF
jgi:hypothetical protein